MTANVKPRFIEPMLLLRTEMLPQGPEWGYEIKLDGYCAQAFKTGGQLSLRSRNDNDFALRYPSIAKALASFPDDTAVDGEIVALDEAGPENSRRLPTGLRTDRCAPPKGLAVDDLWCTNAQRMSVPCFLLLNQDPSRRNLKGIPLNWDANALWRG